MMYVSEKQQIISCAKDKSIKIWQLPDFWMDEHKVIQQVQQEERLESDSLEVKQKNSQHNSEEMVQVLDQENQ